ncbi:signal transducer and activator of transcription B [Drosophila sulfurigaster albostrigata]|uniref:signal transducer and activator of transcription B n=1 Tax=Drosophila sulfurigaster albostrigata TaxID=89887 RepID=UPI002D21D206|nr:signal transducer and activator of transcription B [Drosophila sulfurigaster albostrigata]
MTLPTNTNSNGGSGAGSGSGSDDDSDMFGPPRCSPPIGYHHHRSRVPMISPKLRQREERKRILQLCAHKLERIKDSETNLRRSVCINNTYCRLTDELRREKQLRYVQNLPKTENSSTTELARENLFQPNMDDAKPNMNNNNNKSLYGDNNVANATTGQQQQQQLQQQQQRTICSIENHQSPHRPNCNTNNSSSSSSSSSSASSVCSVSSTAARKRHLSNSNLVNDLEILDRELSAINAPMPLIDPEITQGAEQLEKAALSAARKRLRSNSSEDESDRLVREALSQFYMPPQRLISAIEDCPLDVVGMGMNMVVGGGGAGAGATNLLDGSGNNISSSKRIKLSSNVGGVASDHLDLVDFDMNQNQKDFEVIMDALRLGTPSPPSGASSDSCGQAAMMSESASVFHNLVVTSLET